MSMRQADKKKKTHCAIFRRKFVAEEKNWQKDVAGGESEKE